MTNIKLNNRYLLQRRLDKTNSQYGRTSPNRTYRAVDLQSQQLVVIKLFLFGAGGNWDSFKLFEREAKTLKSLKHPAIPTYRDYFELETVRYKGFALVQDFVAAPSLQEYIDRGRIFSEPELKQIAIAILDILEYLHHHSTPIIHRDLKPENILLGNRSGNKVGKVYLVDFGSVQTAASTGAISTVVGTYGYMPPEQFGGKALPASDLYALGATIVHLASAKHPADLPQQELQLCFEKYVGLSPQFQKWLQKMTKPNLDGRIASAVEARKTLHKPVKSSRTELLSIKKEAVQRDLIHSKIVLTKTSDRLEIYIPSEKSIANLLGSALGAVWSICSSTFFMAILVQAMKQSEFLASLIVLCFCIPLFGIASYCSVKDILFTLWGSTSLKIDSEKVALKYQIFNFISKKDKSVKTTDITKLEYASAYSELDLGGAAYGLSRRHYPPQVNIWAKNGKLTLTGGDNCRSALEMEWLVYELALWLDIEITYTQRQPQENNKE